MRSSCRRTRTGSTPWCSPATASGISRATARSRAWSSCSACCGRAAPLSSACARPMRSIAPCLVSCATSCFRARDCDRTRRRTVISTCSGRRSAGSSGSAARLGWIPSASARTARPQADRARGRAVLRRRCGDVALGIYHQPSLSSIVTSVRRRVCSSRAACANAMTSAPRPWASAALRIARRCRTALP
jgi:hypothetical protein